MKKKDHFIQFYLVKWLFYFVGITFDTQVTLTVVDPDLLGGDKVKHEDPVNTGWYYYITGHQLWAGVVLNLTLTLNF